jgi:hypothetical protein
MSGRRRYAVRLKFTEGVLFSARSFTTLSTRVVTLYIYVSKKGRALAEAVTPWPLKAEARVRSLASRYDICGRQPGTGTGFFHSTSIFLCQYHSTNAPYFILVLLLYEGQAGESW